MGFNGLWPSIREKSLGPVAPLAARASSGWATRGPRQPLSGWRLGTPTRPRRNTEKSAPPKLATIAVINSDVYRRWYQDCHAM